MADLMTECNYLNPDVEVIAEINSSESFETFAEVLNTGHGVIGTTHAADVETLVNRLVEQGIPPYLLSEFDLVVFPRHIDGERYVGKWSSCSTSRGTEHSTGRMTYVASSTVARRASTGTQSRGATTTVTSS
ncbi:ATPase, T2SS/T4P/T4SS family [Haloarculaceae archaeon H-GB11]|nr:ATPase, T2SS/T4P/T4SS family [Haloarculaceae archaeon H-GB11]